MATFVLGFTGGSGAVYGLRLMQVLLDAGHSVQAVASDAGMRVLRLEQDVHSLKDAVPESLHARLTVFDQRAVESTPASGSAAIAAVVICPCSMGTLARVAHGFSQNLVERAADVALKEGRTLIVVPRETPYSLIHLRNMQALVEAGAVVLPASPGFYHRPGSIADVVDFVVARILDQMGLDHDLVARWQTPDATEESSWNEAEL